MVEIIKEILEKAHVPKYWYSINKPVEDRISIIEKTSRIHIFIQKHGKHTGEKVYTNWYEAITDIAEAFELKYTEKVMKIADEYMKEDKYEKSKLN